MMLYIGMKSPHIFALSFYAMIQGMLSRIYRRF
jgi:hypothetical protein